MAKRALRRPIRFTGAVVVWLCLACSDGGTEAVVDADAVSDAAPEVSDVAQDVADLPPGDDPPADAPPADPGLDEEPPSCLAPVSPNVVRGPAGTQKVCQLTGERDRERDELTVNQTWTNAHIWGTDLGASFEHDGRLWFLFGDTIGETILGEDAIARTDDADPDDCVGLDFLVDAGGRWLAPEVPGVSLGAFEVPLDGVSVNGAMYVYFSTDHSAVHTMGRSVLARSDDNGRSFRLIGDISTLGPFINVSVVVVDNVEWPGVPSPDGQGLLIWGSGEYRQSNVALAWQPLDEIESPSAIRYFTGTSSDDCSPQWSDREEDAWPLFEEPCVGELSVEWNPHLDKWVMTYNCLDPRGIRFRTADRPWGPWSESQSLFHPWEDEGYCHFMHVSHADQDCDDVSDPGRELEYGGEYGPYQIAPYTRAVPGGAAIYFVMSTWNPYNVVLMRSELVLE